MEKLGLINGSVEPRNPTNSIRPYALLTLHRPSNVDDKHAFLNIIRALTEIGTQIPVIFPVHPRTLNCIKKFSFQNYFNFLHPDFNKFNEPNGPNDHNPKNSSNPINSINLISPLGYLDFLNLMMHATFVLTDSGGIQEETTVLEIPCLTLRNNTERPITVTEGTNVLVWNGTQRILREAFKILNGQGKNGTCPQLWNGRAAERIVDILVRDYHNYGSGTVRTQNLKS